MCYRGKQVEEGEEAWQRSRGRGGEGVPWQREHHELVPQVEPEQINKMFF